MAEITASTNREWGLNALQTSRSGVLVLVGALIALIGATLFPPAAYSIDEAVYVDMAQAFASRGAFDVTPQQLPPGAPVMAKSDHLIHIIDNRAVPQYPALYGVIAAPFFLLLGIKGLVLLNALSGVFALWMTHRIARALTNDPWVANASVIVLGAASIFAGYIFAIWPHMLALAFILAGADLALRAGKANRKRALIFAAAAGVVFGFGVGVRVDVVLAAVAAFFWLRLFAKPSERFIALALVAGLAPGLLAMAAINQAKFGAFNPFSYGAEAGSISIGHHMKVIGAAGFAALFALIVDTSSKPVAAAIGAMRRLPAPALITAALLVLFAVAFSFPGLYAGAWLMLVDIQSYGGPSRPGLEKDVYGYWDFWGAPKKALLQSMPWAALTLAPLIAFCRGRNTAMIAYPLLFAAAFILFFAMRGWHGGMGYNMRYYLPAAPFLAVLAALALRDLRPAFERHKSLALRSAAVGVVLAMLAYALSPLYGAFAVPSQLYPQLLVAAGLVGVLAFAAFRPENRAAKNCAAAFAGVGVAFAAMTSLFDAHGYWKDRARYVSYDRAYAAMTEDDSVIFTQFDELLVGASLNGAMIIRVTEANHDEIASVIGAYEQTGRCIYAHTAPAAHALSPELFEALPMPADAPEPGLSLFVYRDSPARCR